METTIHAVVVAGDIADQGAGLHQLQVLPIDDMILPVLGPHDTVEQHVRLPEALLKVGAIGDEEGHVIGQVLPGLLHGLQVYVTHFGYKTPQERVEAARKAANIWNMGKVIRPDPGE